MVLVTGGRALLLALWFLGHLLVIRALDPGEFGVYALCIAGVKMVSSFLGDSADLAVLRQVPLTLSRDPSAAVRAVHASFLLRLAAGLVALLGGVALASPIAGTFLHAPERAWLVPVAAAGVLGDLLLRSVSTYFQAAQRFGRFMLVEASWQISRFAIVLGLFGLQRLSAGAALTVYVGVPYVVFALGVCLVPRELRRPSAIRARDLADVLAYVKWLLLGFAVAAVFDRVEVMLLGYFSGPAGVGIYSAALALATIPDFLTGCAATVLHPRVVPAYTRGEFGAFARQYLRYAIPAGILALAGALLLGGVVLEAFFSQRYVSAIPLFRVLVLGTVFWAVVSPMPAALLAMVAPRRMLGLNIGALAASTAAGLVAIPSFGPGGAAVAFVAVRILLGGWLLLFARRILREGPASGPDTLAPKDDQEPVVLTSGQAAGRA
jgi:O-antigen/teichoic acid export membrane protein